MNRINLQVVVDGKTIKQVDRLYAWARNRGGCKQQQEEGGRYYVAQKVEETAKGKSVGSLRDTSLCIRVGNTCTDRETSGQTTYSIEQLG